jgi:hypothetical protein
MQERSDYMIKVDGQKDYQGAYAERVQNRQAAHQMMEGRKDASAERVKEAMEKTKASGGNYDSFSASEEAKNFLNGESQKADSSKKMSEFAEYTKIYKDERIAKAQDSFWKNTGKQYLVFSQKLNESGFFDSMSDKEVRETESILRTITKGMDSLSNAWYLTGQGPSGADGKGYTLPTSYEARMELESSVAALIYFGETCIEDEGLRKEFEGLANDYYAHNTEVLNEYANPVEQMDKAVSRFHANSQSGLCNDLFAKAASQNSDRVSYSKYMGGVTHTKEEEQQYRKELSGLFGQLKQNSFGQADIWRQIQNTMLNYATNGGGSKLIREQVLAGAWDSFSRMEDCWSLLLNKE